MLGVLWWDHHRQTILPTPTGSFAVGRTTCVWSDTAHKDPLAPLPEAKRNLFAWIWYPAEPRQSTQAFASYLPSPWIAAVDAQRGVLISQFLTRDLSQVRTHSINEATLSNKERSYPVILMRAGLASLATGYTSLAEDLASHGYVVVAFDAPYRSSVVVFPNGQVFHRSPQNNADLVSGPQQENLVKQLLKAWSSDMSFAVDQLENLNSSSRTNRFLNRLDMQRLGVFGHSLGGATALQFCLDDSRCKVGIDIDGAPMGNVIAEGVTQPFMFLFSDHGNDPGRETLAVETNIRSVYDRLPAESRLQIRIKGATHFKFSDDGAILKVPLIMRAMKTLRIDPMDGRRQIALTALFTRAFFDAYLKGEPSSILKSQTTYPEIEFVR